MSLNSKHLATFIIGAAAGVALQKYLKTEEGEKMLDKLKTKAGDLKSEAEDALDKAPEYFDELKTMGAEALKTSFPEAEKYINEFLSNFTGRKPVGEAPPAP